jgi:predicted DNA-binding transcriptional regulator YafY
MNRVERLYAVNEELRAAGSTGRTADWLARRFEVSVRTVKRDVAALQEAGAPVAARPGPHGGYALVASTSLPPLNLTAPEAVAIAMALQRTPPGPYARDGRSALTKLLGGLPADERSHAQDLAGRLWLRLDADPPRTRVAVALDEAVRRCVVTRVDYTDAQGARTTRDVEPAALAQTGGHWYLLAHCRLRAGPRWFRLDRIRAANHTTEPAPRHDPATEFGEPPSDARAVAL